MADIYQYLDYRTGLSDAFRDKKAQVASFSHRAIAQRLNIKSSGYILYVMQGKRKLTEKMAAAIAQIFGLTKPQTGYLLQLVRYTHALTSQEKQYQFERLVSLRRRYVRDLEPEHYRFYEKWYCPVIREVLAVVEFRGDYEALGAMLVPRISGAEAAEALLLLLELGMVFMDENGVYRKKDAVVSTGESWRSEVIHAHQRDLLTLGREALDSLPKSDRDISHLTITASKSTMELVSQRIAHLRAEILEIARLEKEPDRVVQCNFMVFPVAMKQGECR